LREKLASIKVLRKIFIPILKLFNFRFKWKHDITKRPFYLESYNHKSYWYFGKDNIEPFEIDTFYKLIKKGDKVLEVGTHIGYMTQIFEEIIGDDGQVVVVEPTPESNYYLKKNVLPTTQVISKAASNYCGKSKFYTSNSGGFTNSLDKEFLVGFEEKILKKQSNNYEVNAINVDVDTLDNICKEHDFYPTFLKIDVEGAELNVLKGASNILNSVNSLMIEITFPSDAKEIFQILEKNGFKECYQNSKSHNCFFKK